MEGKEKGREGKREKEGGGGGGVIVGRNKQRDKERLQFRHGSYRLLNISADTN